MLRAPTCLLEGQARLAAGSPLHLSSQGLSPGLLPPTPVPQPVTVSVGTWGSWGPISASDTENLPSQGLSRACVVQVRRQVVSCWGRKLVRLPERSLVLSPSSQTTHKSSETPPASCLLSLTREVMSTPIRLGLQGRKYPYHWLSACTSDSGLLKQHSWRGSSPLRGQTGAPGPCSRSLRCRVQFLSR